MSSQFPLGIKPLFPLSFYTSEELKNLDTSDLYFEISDTALVNTPQANNYLNLLIHELQQRNS